MIFHKTKKGQYGLPWQMHHVPGNTVYVTMLYVTIQCSDAQA